MIREQLRGLIQNALHSLNLEEEIVELEQTTDPLHGDYATNVALMYAKKAGLNPRELAQRITEELSRAPSSDIEKIEIAGPGFINFRLSDEYFSGALDNALKKSKKWGNNETLAGKKVIVEYADPNPFKEFHIGHLMSNTIGESIARIIEASGADTKRACYQGDVGMHVAKAVWGMIWIPNESGKPKKPSDDASLQKKISFIAESYAFGATAFEANPSVKEQIAGINKNIYSREGPQTNEIYDWGRKVSLDYFETIYKKLGTKFDFNFFESQTGEFGKKVVLENPAIFEKSDGAIVYKGDESKGLHTRVFINSEGLPTYESKELGLAKIKYDIYPYDTSIVITGNEVNDYFRVILDAMSKVFPELAKKTVHISHGMLRLPSGKMSSRTGDVITAESLIADTKERALAKISQEAFLQGEKDILAEKVALGAIKYSILKQASGKDIIFDFEQSLSFEGDSGPYLQYTYARTRSLLEKAKGRDIDVLFKRTETNALHKVILHFPEIVLRANEEREPHFIATYLIELAREFNSFYAHTIVLNDAPDEPHKLALVKAVSQTLENGLNLLGISAPERM
ncbi:MAG: arginine--tRNA ligase [Candidatus Yonathbacteria bacterium]|nr:arginine--tRNA ligase [Candidatus Yonathbacteria bacterium]